METTPSGHLQINYDGSFNPSNRSGGWGFFVRDNSGEVRAAGAGNITYAASSLQAEVIAAYKSIIQASCLIGVLLVVWCIRYETLCVTISPAVLSLCVIEAVIKWQIA